MRNSDQRTELADLQKLKRAQELMSLNDLIGAKILLEAIEANVPDTYKAISSDGTKLIIRYWDEDELDSFLTYSFTIGEKREVVSQQSVYPKALYLLAHIAVEEGEHEKAVDLLDKVLELEPDQPRCYAELAFIASMINDIESSFNLYQKALELRHFCGKNLKAIILRGLGVQSIELKNYEAAERFLKESLSIEPDNKSTLHELAYLAHLNNGGEKKHVAFDSTSNTPAPYFPICCRCGKRLVVNIDNYRVFHWGGSHLCICSDCEEKDRYIELVRKEAESCFHKGDFEKSLSLQNEILNFDPEDAQAHCNRGLCFAGMGKHEDAIRDFDHAIMLAPDYMASYYNRGISLAETGQPEKAINDLTKAIELSKGSHAEIFIWRGLCFRELDKNEHAIKDFTEAVSIDPESKDAYLNRANTYKELDNLPAALRDINHVISMSPNIAGAYFDRSRLYDSMGKAERAYEDVERAIAIDPSITKYHYLKGLICSTLARYQDAVSAFSSAIKGNDGTLLLSDLFQKRALSHLALGEMDAAVEDFKKSLSEGADAIDCHYYLGYLFVETGDFARALVHLEESLRLKPDHVESRFSRGVAFRQMERHIESIDDMTYVISREPNNALAYLNRGNSFSSVSKYHEAIADFSRAIDIVPDMVDAYCERAFALYEIGESERAFSDLDVAMSLDDKNSKPYIAKAILLIGCDKLKEALAFVAAAEEREPGNKGIEIVRAEAYKLLGEIKENS